MASSPPDLTRISRRLRKQRLAEEQSLDPISAAPTRPDLYYDFAPAGSYPIIALRTIPCDRYIKGQCLPCSYSARPYPAGLAREQLYAGLETQLEWLLEHFDEIVTSRANGRLDGYRLRAAPDWPWYSFQLAGESSFFRDAEIPPNYRRRLLERLVEFQRDRQINLHLMLECRPEDLLSADQSGELAQLTPLFRELDVVVNMGLEYRDDWLRNQLFAKDLDRQLFERSIRTAHSHRLDPGVFVFAGGPILTPGEILRETRRTLAYLEEQWVFVNLMVPNLQSHTLPDLLWDSGIYDLPEPFFLLDIADLALTYQPGRANPVTPFDWFIGGLESDPEPRFNLINQPRRSTPDELALEIHRALLDLVRTLDVDRYRRRANRLRNTVAGAAWYRQLERADPRPWPVRLKEAMASAQDPVAKAKPQIPTDAD